MREFHAVQFKFHVALSGVKPRLGSLRTRILKQQSEPNLRLAIDTKGKGGDMDFTDFRGVISEI